MKIVDKEANELTQEVTSMQIEHANIDIAKSGDEFGLKVDSPLKTNSEVFKIK